MRFAPLLLWTLGSLSAAPVPKEHRKSGDYDRIVGTWVGVDTDTVRFQFAADGTLKTWYGPNPINTAMNWKWTITDTKSLPKIARITRAENASAWYDCVYELTGDTMRFALILSNDAPRPEQVAPQSGLEFHSLAREKASK